jgi:hypothetical protein
MLTRFEQVFWMVVTVVLMACAVITIPAALIYWEVYKFQDCKKVGHTTAYCLFATK